MEDNDIYTEKERVICPCCGGTGSHPWAQAWCPECDGEGYVLDSFEI